MRALLNFLGLTRATHEPVAAVIPPAAASPRCEVHWGEPLAVRVRAALERNDWRAAADLMDSPMSPDDRQFFSDALAEWSGLPKWVNAWVEVRPNSPSAWLIHGSHGMKWAWQARGTGYGNTVSEDAVNAFFARLERAEQSLLRAASLDPGDATPWSWLIRNAIGLQLEESETARRFGEAVRRAPSHRQAHSARLQSLARKWGGSHEKMWEFVKHSTAGVGPGSSLFVLVAEAHIEMWFAATADNGHNVPAGFFRDPSIQRSLLAASQSAFAPGAFRPTIDSVRNRNYFAFCLWKAGLLREAGEHFAALGNWVTESPWCFVGEPAKVFAGAQRECGAMVRAAA